MKFQPDVCNGCHDVLIMSMNLSKIAILNIDRKQQKWGYKCNVKCQYEWKKQNNTKQENLLLRIKTGTEILALGNVKIEKDKLYCFKSTIFLEDVDIKNVLVPNKIYSGEKYYKILGDYFYDDCKVKLMFKKRAHMPKVIVDKPAGWIFFI